MESFNVAQYNSHQTYKIHVLYQNIPTFIYVSVLASLVTPSANQKTMFLPKFYKLLSCAIHFSPSVIVFFRKNGQK